MHKNIVKNIFKKWEMAVYQELFMRYEILWSRTHNIQEEDIKGLIRAEDIWETMKAVYYELLVEAGGSEDLLYDYSWSIECKLLAKQYNIHNQEEFNEVFKGESL